MPRLILLMLLMTATLSLKAQIPKDTTVTHDSTYYKLIPVTETTLQPKDTITTHDTANKVITINKFSTTHDSLQRKGTRPRPNQMVLKPTTHDTTTYIYSTVITRIQHDTIIYRWKTDTTGYKQQAFHTTITHDSIVYYYPPTFNIIKFGLKIQQDNFNNQVNVANQIGMTAVRPVSIGVRDYNGTLGNVVQWKNAGFFTVQNIEWITNPNEKPYNFVSGADTIKFKINFEKICQALVGYADVIVIENEPANGTYFIWASNTDANAYIHELKMAITIAHKYGLKISDGCCHLEYVELIRTNKWQNNAGATRNKALMDAYKTLNLDYVDFHCRYDAGRGGYPVPDLKTTIDYYGTYTGHQPITNEYSIAGGTPQVSTWFVSGWRAAQIPIAVGWSGDDVKADAYNIGLNLTALGIQYKADIK